MEQEGGSNCNATTRYMYQGRLAAGQCVERTQYSEATVYIFPCEKCGEFFKGEQKLEEHKKTHIDDGELYLCIHCGKCCNTRESLELHKKEKHTCSHCGKCFSKTATLLRHQRSAHAPKHKCPQCTREFRSILTLRKHQLTHAPKPHQCVPCKKRFRTQAEFDSHIHEAHPGIKPYKCLECNKRFAKGSALQSHQLVHTGMGPSCSQCGKVFQTKQILHSMKQYILVKSLLLANIVEKLLGQTPSGIPMKPFIQMKSLLNARYVARGLDGLHM